MSAYVSRADRLRDIKRALRELNNQVALLDNQVGSRADLRPVDLDCLDVVTLRGPLSPSELARRAGLHPATITGILDRLEKNRWVVRERDDGDRRAVRVRALPDRARELATLADFLQRASAAGFDATSALAEA